MMGTSKTISMNIKTLFDNLFTRKSIEENYFHKDSYLKLLDKKYFSEDWWCESDLQKNISQELKGDLEKLMSKLNPEFLYNVKEKLNSGVIITHKTDATLQEVKNYCRKTWLDIAPPNFIFEVTTSR